jgi:beta-phosphoglucomutase family hydrolase
LAYKVAPYAVIFDMDGTLIDNTPYHLKSWQELFVKYNKGTLSAQTYYTEISGVPVMDTIRRIFGGEYDEAGLVQLRREKDQIYEQEYAPFIKPISGLEDFLAELKKAGIKMALGSSATIDNIDFVFSHIAIRQYFDVIIDSSQVTLPKPNAQVFLKAAEGLGTDHHRCVVFEDSLAGFKAANAAGMKVVGITTGHSAAELKPLVDLVIHDYAALSPQQLFELF